MADIMIQSQSDDMHLVQPHLQCQLFELVDALLRLRHPPLDFNDAEFPKLRVWLQVVHPGFHLRQEYTCTSSSGGRAISVVRHL